MSVTTLSDNTINDDNLLELSLEELISLEITSISRKKQRLIQSAGAIYVITQDDIRQSGATSIPDALRMAPGMQVFQMNGSTWSISVRGFNYIFANKLLVLMDGRTLYTPLFSGVNWDIQDTIMESIERIEIIRGPGAALWGANAVNGVINIITKSASKTQGGFVNLVAGNLDKLTTDFWYGDQLGDNIHYRIFAKSFQRSGLVNDDKSQADDKWNIDRLGFRIDWHVANSNITLQGDIYQGTTNPPLKILNHIDNNVYEYTDKRRDQQGGNLIINWHKKINDLSEFSIKSYYDDYYNDDYRIRTDKKTVDIETQYRVKWHANHDLIWGFGYRSSWYDLSRMHYIVVNDKEPKQELVSTYIQNEFVPSKNWQLTTSARLEHHDKTGYEFQPNIRLAWMLNSRSTAWMSLSQAVRTPAITDQDFEVKGIPDPQLEQSLSAFGLRGSLSLTGNKSMKSERLTAFEFGYRQQLSESFSFDIASFINQYEGLISLSDAARCPEKTIPSTTPLGNVCAISQDYMLVPSMLTNGLDATTYGIELIANIEATDWWRLEADFSFLQTDAIAKNENILTKKTEHIVEGLSAKFSANLRSMITLSPHWKINIWLRYMDENESATTDAYTSLNAKVTYNTNKKIALSIGGNNIFDESRLEFTEQFTGLIATQIKESWYAQIQWHF